MRTGGKTALTVRGACLAAGLAFCLANASDVPPVLVVMSDRAVSIKAKRQSIRTVLEELSRQTNLQIYSGDALDELVTLDIDQPTLSEAIRSLLRQKSYMLHQVNHIVERDSLARENHNRLWMFSDKLDAGQPGWSIKPNFRPDVGGDMKMVDYQILALSENGDARADAMVGFGDIGGEGAVEYLQHGLSDPDERVRGEAIESLLEIGGEVSLHILSIVLNDPDAGLRIDAVDAMGEIGGQEAIKYLQLAMTDENHTVREAAAEWLTELTWQQD